MSKLEELEKAVAGSQQIIMELATKYLIPIEQSGTHEPKGFSLVNPRNPAERLHLSTLGNISNWDSSNRQLRMLHASSADHETKINLVLKIFRMEKKA